MVPEEQNTLGFTLGALRWLDPLAPSGGLPHTLDKAERTAFSIRSVMTAHNLLDCL